MKSILLILFLALSALAGTDRLEVTTNFQHYSHVLKRDSHGKISRSSTARRDFLILSGYPNGRPGYVVDHIIALKRGGFDCPCNMQWQTISDAKEKDKAE
jgi:hypothetical protein